MNCRGGSEGRDSTESSVRNGNERANDGEEADTVDESEDQREDEDAQEVSVHAPKL